MSLLPATQKIISLVEETSKRPVHITEDPELTTLATMTTARGDAPMHLVRYKPRGSEPPDYFIAFQLGFVVRLFRAPPDQRFEYGASPVGKQKMTELLLASEIS